MRLDRPRGSPGRVTPTEGEVPAGQTVATTFTISDTNSASLTTTNSNTSVVVTALSYVNGPAGGHATLVGPRGKDNVITAQGQHNIIFGEGTNDIINAGSGYAAVTLIGNGSATVTPWRQQQRGDRGQRQHR